MANNQAYDLYSNGTIIDGFEQQAVVESFSGLFKCTPEKAAMYTQSKKVIRKDIDQATAQSYAVKLKNIGLDVALIPRTPPSEEQAAANGELSLAPIDNPSGPTTSEADVESQRRERDAKIKAIAAKNNQQTPTIKAIAGPLIATGLGALLWAITIKMGYEIGLVALAIGGMIGWIAKTTNFTGYVCGVICALLCASAIFGGKYLGYSWEVDEFIENAGVYVNEEGVSETWEDIYAREAAQLRAMEHTDANIKQFMLDNNYTQDDSPITQEDIDFFREYQIPDIEEWAKLNQGELLNEIESDVTENLSITSLIFSDLRITDLLFLIAGMGAAFRLASDNDSDSDSD